MSGGKANGADRDLGSLLGRGAGGSPADLAPYLTAAAQLGLSEGDLAAGFARLREPDSPLRAVLADVLRPDFASPEDALTHLQQRLAGLDPLDARILLVLVAGAAKAAAG